VSLFLNISRINKTQHKGTETMQVTPLRTLAPST